MLERPQNSSADQRCEDLKRAIGLAEQALAICDLHECAFAAISLSQAIEKLKAIQQQ